MEACAPPFLGSICFDCRECGKLEISTYTHQIQIVILVVEFISGTLSNNGLFYFFFVYVVAIHCLIRYLEIVKTTHHPNCRFRTYRNLQLLERCLNDFGHLRILPATMAGAPVLQIVAMFAIIKLRDEMQYPGFLIFPMVFIGAFSGLVVMQTLSAKLMLESEDLVGIWKTKNSIGPISRNSKYRRRMIQSMQGLKVRFGANFMDRETTLVTQNFCVGQTASLLILQN
jgi:hypothetical protein